MPLALVGRPALSGAVAHRYHTCRSISTTEGQADWLVLYNVRVNERLRIGTYAALDASAMSRYGPSETARILTTPCLCSTMHATCGSNPVHTRYHNVPYVHDQAPSRHPMITQWQSEGDRFILFSATPHHLMKR